MEFVCKPNMALHLNRDIRPNVVLECSFGAQIVFKREGEEKDRVLQEEVILV